MFYCEINKEIQRFFCPTSSYQHRTAQQVAARLFMVCFDWRCQQDAVSCSNITVTKEQGRGTWNKLWWNLQSMWLICSQLNGAVCQTFIQLPKWQISFQFFVSFNKTSFSFGLSITSAFIEMLPLTDDQLISAVISSTWLILTLLTHVEAVRVHLIFHILLLFCFSFCSIKNDTVICLMLFTWGWIYWVLTPAEDQIIFYYVLRCKTLELERCFVCLFVCFLKLK